MVEKRKIIIIILFCFLLSGILAFFAWYGSSHAHVVVAWTTASELNTAGFYVYRGLASDENLTLLNAQLIPPSTDALSGGNYQYEDSSADAGQTYHYVVEEVDFSGSRSRFGPIEIQAKGGGKIEGLLAFVLAGFGLTGLVYWAVRNGRQEQK
jgi:hypothetical protein